MLFNSEMRKMSSELTDRWWVFLILSMAWFFIGIIILRFNISSAATVGLLLGAFFLYAAVSQFVLASIEGGAWGVLRIILGILFVGSSIWSFVTPYNAFWALAAAFGLILIVNGAFDIAYSALAEPVNPLWWLGLVTGIFEIALGFWASQQYIRARAVLLLLWVGIYAILRGVNDLVLALELEAAR